MLDNEQNNSSQKLPEMTQQILRSSENTMNVYWNCVWKKRFLVIGFQKMVQYQVFKPKLLQLFDFLVSTLYQTLQQPHTTHSLPQFPTGLKSLVLLFREEH